MIQFRSMSCTDFPDTGIYVYLYVYISLSVILLTLI